jgi:hypothetical protein
MSSPPGDGLGNQIEKQFQATNKSEKKMDTKQYCKPQLIELGDAIKATLGRYRRGHRDHRRYYYR